MLVLVAAAGAAGVSGIGAQVRCGDAAREGARAAALGDSPIAAAGAVAPAGARIAVSRQGESVRVSVSARTGGFARLLPAFTVHADATARYEPGVGADP